MLEAIFFPTFVSGLSPAHHAPGAAANPKTLLDRPARSRGLALLVLVIAMLAILGGMIWRTLGRLDTVQAYVAYSHRIQEAGLDLQQALVDSLAGVRLVPERFERQSDKIRELIRIDAHLDQDTPGRLAAVDAAVRSARDAAPAEAGTELADALRVMSLILSAETDHREKVLEEISRDTLAELELTTGALIAILLLAWVFLRSRILAPLTDLKHLLLKLAKEDFAPMEMKGLDPLLAPVFTSYNEMVRHLRELEEGKREHARSLQAEVRAVTQALLEQQRNLAHAERLAVIGELAASVAHELRNPLAGIQMSCQNLRNEVNDRDQAERLDLIGNELKRMTRLLNDLLAQGRQTPMPANDFPLADMIRELLALTRFQIPAHIALEQDIPADLVCHLPECNLRQVLLNLVLNSAHALDKAPGTITLSAGSSEGHVFIDVADDGPGFPQQMLAGGIRPFASGSARGTGLGLAIVQRFIRDMGGQMRLSNREPHGACVSLTLPAGSSA